MMSKKNRNTGNRQARSLRKRTSEQVITSRARAESIRYAACGALAERHKPRRRTKVDAVSSVFGLEAL